MTVQHDPTVQLIRILHNLHWRCKDQTKTNIQFIRIRVYATSIDSTTKVRLSELYTIHFNQCNAKEDFPPETPAIDVMSRDAAIAVRCGCTLALTQQVERHKFTFQLKEYKIPALKCISLQFLVLLENQLGLIVHRHFRRSLFKQDIVVFEQSRKIKKFYHLFHSVLLFTTFLSLSLFMERSSSQRYHPTDQHFLLLSPFRD